MYMPMPQIAEVRARGWHTLSKREFNNLMKKAWQRVGEFWIQNFLPRHFQPGAASRYGYKRRSRETVARGRALNAAWRPLHMTGRLEREVLGPGGARVIASFRGVRITLRHHPVDMMVHEELTRITEDERQELMKVFHQEFAKLLDGVKKTKRKRTGNATAS